MAIVQGVTKSFREELFKAVHDFTSDTFKIALFTSDASLGDSTTAYSTDNEVSGAGYSAGGATLTVTAPTTSSGVTYIDFADVEWATSTITARGALIYNSSKSNKAVYVLNFGFDRSSSASTFTVKFPAADKDHAILRIRL